MNWQTEKKIIEIKELIEKGYTRKDILQKKFNRSVSSLNKHLEIGKDFYTVEELNLLNNVESRLVEIKKGVKVPKAITDEREAEAFDRILAHSEEIIEMALKIKNGEIPDSYKIQSKNKKLEIPDEFLELDIKLRSFRISKETDKRFTEYCEKHKLYSKTAIFNFALEELMKNYPK